MAQVTYRGIVYDTDRSRKQTQQNAELSIHSIQLDDVYFPNQSEFPFHCYEKILN